MPIKSVDEKLASLENQIKKLFNLYRSLDERNNTPDDPYNSLPNTFPTEIQIVHAHEWRKSFERIHPPRISQYGALYYRPSDLDRILAEYIISCRKNGQ